ncbi:MAG: hypothetical protein JW699_07480 [Chitinispirillaceae bacterium]|nr:hypothetical protein [Chitinispirillaceae bacterium]
MVSAQKLHPKYVTQKDGRKRAVILPIEEYTELLEDLKDLAVIAERREEPSLFHNKVMEEIKHT